MRRKEFWSLSDEETNNLLVSLCCWGEAKGLTPERLAIFMMVAYKMLFDELGISIESYTKHASQKIKN